MPRQTKTAEEIREAIRQELYQDKELEWRLAGIPYFTIQALPPGQLAGAVNWELNVSSCAPEFAAAIQRAKVNVQSRFNLASLPLGSSAFSSQT